METALHMLDALSLYFDTQSRKMTMDAWDHLRNRLLCLAGYIGGPVAECAADISRGHITSDPALLAPRAFQVSR